MNRQVLEKVVKQFVDDSLKGKENEEHLISIICSDYKLNTSEKLSLAEEVAYFASQSKQMEVAIKNALKSEMSEMENMNTIEAVTSMSVMASMREGMSSVDRLIASSMRNASAIDDIRFHINLKFALSSLFIVNGSWDLTELTGLKDYYLSVSTWSKEEPQNVNTTVVSLHQYIVGILSGLAV